MVIYVEVANILKNFRLVKRTKGLLSILKVTMLDDRENE